MERKIFGFIEVWEISFGENSGFYNIFFQLCGNPIITQETSKLTLTKLQRQQNVKNNCRNDISPNRRILW